MTEFEPKMRTPSALFLALFPFSFCLSSQAPSVPYAQFFGPDFDNVHVDHSYPAPYPSIRKVDFRNWKLVVYDQSGKQDSVLLLKNGSHKWKEKGGEVDEAKLEEVAYLTPAGTDPEYALVIFHWMSVAGASNTDGYAQVFKLTDQALRVIQQLRWNEQFETKEKYSFDAKTNALVARSAHYLPGDAHCCISAMDVFTLRWNGSAFVQTAVTTELSDYGKREGKTLPR
jgi:hypothetical protein